jgi:Holliday junction DNA helicase RuvA
MIVQIQGRLLKLDTDRAVMQVGPVAYEIMLAGYMVSSLTGKIGSDIMLCTLEYYEGTPAGGNLIPRMVGFMSEGEKDFFVKYTTVKGIGIKKALRSLSIPIATVATAVEEGNEKTLLALPEIGRRLAQQIIAELKGKLTSFAVDAGKTAAAARSSLTAFQIEALEILIAWGEKRTEAAELIELACKKHPNIKTAEELVPLVYRIKQGAEA